MIRIFTLLAFTILTMSQSFGQHHVNYDRDSRWFIGLNMGGTWTTQTEVPYRVQGGYGFTFGKSFGMEEDKLFSWDLRARFLHAWFQGQATNRYSLDSTSMLGLGHYGPALNTYQDSLGYFIPNYRSNLLSGSLELVLNTNRLRQNTGWNLSVFGGIGYKGYHVATNLVEDDLLGSGDIYDYDQLNSTSQSNVLNLQDDDFETDIVGDAFNWTGDWMPSFGFGISKQLAPYFALGLEHKMTWTRTNMFDGMPNNFDGTPSTENDIYHYTALTAKFHLFDGKREEVKEEPEDILEEEPIPDPIIDEPVSRKKPIVDIYDPNQSPHSTKQDNFRLRANVYYVDGKSNITFKQDGNINTNFTYNASTDQFESNVVLHPGQNLFEITGTNESGSDYESVIIVYEEELEPQNPPIVTITNPPYTPYTTKSNVFGLVSTVLNVDSKSQIRVYLNGVNLNAFSYDNSAKVVNASLNLKEGVNTVTVTATNDVGSDSKTVEIIFERQIKTPPPVISFVNPGVDPYYTTVSSIGIRANALHVATKSDLTVRVNGNSIGAFTFNTATKEIYFNTGLIEGANIVEITGVNEAGSDMASTTIIYTRAQTPKPPIVTFLDPDIDPITVYTSSYNVTAKVEHVNSAADITLKINGIPSTLFTYSTSSDLMNFSTGLVEGSNVIEIKGMNVHGEDLETTTIIYRRTIPKAPPIVNITNPSVDNVVFESPEMTLIATVLNVSNPADITVLINGLVTTDFTYNISTKVLNLPLVLEEGNNVVQITGTNMSGSDSKTRIIKHKKPVVPCPPTVDFINPPSSPHVVETAEFTLTANTTHIDSKGQIVLKQNGELIPDASYTFTAGHQIIYEATLIPGSNVFEVRVENADGSDDDLAVINFEKEDEPCITPTVGYISPVPYSTVDNADVTIDAQINNHAPGTFVELKLNGLSLGYMTYNDETSIASKDITLLEGSNAINVIVTNNCGTNQATFTLVYEAADAPCDDPTLTASGLTSFTTLEEEISINLTATEVADASELTVKLNGTEIPFAFDSGTGIVTIAGIDLSIGTNTLTISAKTDCGGAVLTYTILREECKVPVISGISPTDGSSTEAESIVLNATVMNATADEIIVLLNGVSHVFSFNADTHVLTEALALEEGANTIEIRAANACGEVSKTIAITREIPCETIVTNLLSPAVSPVVSVEGTYTIVLHATGLTSVDQISATLNGEAVTPSFDVVSGNITLSGLPLVDGNNTVVITMTNDCSESTVSYIVTYNGCEPPVVVINGVVAGMTVTEGVFSLSAVVTNVLDASDITLKVNGTERDFDFNPITHLLTAEIPLEEGTNVIDIEADGCEKVSSTADIIYEKPCEKISHTLMTPTTTPTVSIESEFEITLSTYAVESADQITVTLNAVEIPFEFDTETGIITISGIDLIDGTNTVIVSMENECSSDLVNYAIIYDGCEEPIITFGSNPLEVSAAEYSFEATVANVANAESVEVFLNDAPVPFVFDAVSGALDATVTLAEGDNVIRVLANGCVSKTGEFTVNYTEPCLAITYALGLPAALEAEAAEDTYNINLVVQHAPVAGINVTMAGETLPFTYVDNILSINGISLADGANTVVVAVSNECSSETITYTISHEDCSTPVIDLTANPISTSASIYPFNATVTHIVSADEIQLLLNEVSQPFSFDAVSGTITANLTLNEGVNNIRVTANGCASAVDKIDVSYTVPCAPVTFELVSPASLISETDGEAIGLSLNTTAVDPESIAVTLNGEAIDYNFAGGVISIASVPLIEGTNALNVSFGNECSEETVAYTIEHEHCETPTITINGLTDGMVLTEEDLIFFAVLDHVADASEITVLFNGVGVPFEFNAMSKVLQVPLKLIEGSNSIEVVVNGCESASSGISVVYDVPCAAPSYTLVAPTETAITVEGDSYTVTLTTENVTEEQITVKVNGSSIPFTFSSGTVIFDVPYISVPTNSVVVTLENDCGTASVTYSITFVVEEEDCEPEVSATFGEDNRSVSVTSSMDLINIILNLDDGTTMVIEAVSGKSGTFVPTAPFTERCIVGVWIRSGCNTSDAGEPYGEYVANDAWDGVCEEENPCEPITYSFISPKRLDYATDISPYSITFAATNLEDAGGVSVKVNGVDKTATYDGTRVSLAGIVLSQGVNTVEFTLSNDCDTKKLTYNISYVTFAGKEGDGNDEKPAPVISLMNPIKTSVKVKAESLLLKAKVTNVVGKADIKVKVNGTDFTRFNYSYGSKQLSANLKLNPGVNIIKITASNGKTTDLTYNITYEKQANSGGTSGGNTSSIGGVTPKLERVSPAISVSTTQSSTFVVKTRATNVRSKGDLTMKVNGVKITNFSFSSSTKIMSAAVKLKVGRNDIVVEALNGDRKAKVSYVITYKKVSGQVSGGTGNTNQVGALTPKLERISPSISTSKSQTSTYVVKTRAINVSSKANLSMKVNGVKVTNFSFSSSTKVMTATVKLKEGRNDILVEAVNGGRKAKVSYVITYKKVGGQVQGGTNNNGGGVKGQVTSVKKPEFKLMNPLKTTATVKTQTFAMRLKVLNVKSKNDITFTMNGVKVSAYTFNSSTGEIIANLKLKSGNNSIRISAKNGSQIATLSYTIKYEAEPVKGSVVKPGGTGGNTGTTGTVRRGG